MKKIKVDLPYPNVNKLTADIKAGVTLSPAYCAPEGELSAVLQYVYHAINFDALGDSETADDLRGIACSEMQHFQILGETLIKLGVDPVYTYNPPCKCNFYDTCAISYSKTPKKMLLDDLRGEICAVESYQNILNKLDNEEVGAIITRIKLDEELHIKVLKILLEKYNQK